MKKGRRRNKRRNCQNSEVAAAADEEETECGDQNNGLNDIHYSEYDVV